MVGSTLVRKRGKVGARSGIRSDGAAVDLMVEFLSCGAVLPKHTSVLVPV